MHALTSRSLRVLFALAVLVATGGARAGNLDVLLCNNVNVDLFDCFDLVTLYNATDGDNWINNDNWGTPDVDSWHGVIVDTIRGRVIAVDLASNGLDGEFPPQWLGLQELEFLQLSSNGLGGELPDYLGNLTSLSFLQLGFNDFEGPLPASLGNLTLLDNLFLGGNRFSGTIPASFANLTRLEVLDLLSDSFDASGRLTGTLPDLSGLTRLRRLGLERNRLEGPLPAWLGQLPDLEELILRGNDFSGAIPASLGNAPSLRILDLAANQFTGAIPAALGNIATLEELDLSFNDFTTSLPPALGNLGQLRTLRITADPLSARPQVTGPVPAAFADLPQVEEIDLEFNRLSGALPACLGNLATLRVLNLQGNDLVGAVPEAFTALDLDAFYVGLNFLDADGSNQLITSPTVESWLDGIPSTVSQEFGLGFIDSREQRPIPVDPDAVFASGFESAPGNACP